ncbi:MAG TPA: hypothetical protein V6C95_02515 [Coleofasciculaceae cyanobacterium]
MPNGNGTSKVAAGKLEKAKLMSDESETIEFMFNPSELSFQQSVALNNGDGARTKSGKPKVSFAKPEPCTLTLSNILFDTYEQGTTVLTYIQKFIKAMEFADRGDGTGERPPIYLFTWGDNRYLRCFIQQITYKFTLFLPNGTPVRAKVDMTLKQVDESFTKSSGQNSTVADRNNDNRANRTIFGR